MYIDAVRNLGKVLELVKNPECFLVEKYYKSKVPKGFRLDIFVAQRYTTLCGNLRQFSDTYLKQDNCRIRTLGIIGAIPIKKLKSVIDDCSSSTRRPKKRFCPYCEKLVVPRHTHKLDYGDFVLALFTGGFWIIFIFVMYVFLRRCPICNYSLRGMGSKKNDKISHVK